MWDLTLAPVCQTFDTSLETTRNVKNIQLFIKWFFTFNATGLKSSSEKG